MGEGKSAKDIVSIETCDVGIWSPIFVNFLCPSEFFEPHSKCATSIIQWVAAIAA